MKKIVVSLMALALSGCGIVTPLVRKESKLTKLEVGEDRASAIRKMGNPDITYGKTLENGKIVQIDEYKLFKPGLSIFNAIAGPFTLTATWWTPWLGTRFFDSYAIQYVDGKVHHWGRTDERQPEVVADLTVKQR